MSATLRIPLSDAQLAYLAALNETNPQAGRLVVNFVMLGVRSAPELAKLGEWKIEDGAIVVAEKPAENKSPAPPRLDLSKKRR
jgi:hypothetical protein